MKRTAAIGRIDPIDISEVERVSSSSVFDELGQDIMAARPRGGEFPKTDAPSLRLYDQPRRLRPVAALAVVMAIAIVGGLLVLGGGGGTPTHPTIAGQRTGTWKLADDVLSGTWQQNTKGGPPPGVLSCPNTSICYTMSGRSASPNEGAPLLSVSLYASTDAGVTWSAYSMPQGFTPTSPLACSGTSTSAAGGTDNGQPVLVTTTDGGHSFAIDPLPAGVGDLDTLSCPSTEFCAGLAASSEYLQIGTTDATFLSTSDGGMTFTDSPIIAGDSMQSLSCSSTVDCTAVGWDDTLGPNDLTTGVAARTTDGGHTWAAGTLPAGLGPASLFATVLRRCAALFGDRHDRHCRPDSPERRSCRTSGGHNTGECAECGGAGHISG